MFDQVSEAEDGVAERLNALSAASASNHRTLAEKAFQMLHDAIVGGYLKPGERLPIEDLAEAIELSPMPIREALRRLDSVGLVENVPHRGASVAQLTAEDLREVYDARLVLELAAISKAAELFTDEDKVAATDWLAKLEAATGQEKRRDALDAHTAFHFALYRASSSRWLPRLISPLWDSAERYRVAAIGNSLGLFESRGEEHHALLDACARREPAVAEPLLWNHLVRTGNVIAGQMGVASPYEERPVPRPKK